MGKKKAKVTAKKPVSAANVKVKGLYKPKVKLHAHIKTDKNGKPRRKGW